MNIYEVGNQNNERFGFGFGRPGFGRLGFGRLGFGIPGLGFGLPFLTGIAAGALLTPRPYYPIYQPYPYQPYPYQPYPYSPYPF